MHEHSSNPSYSIKPPPELPPCCGTGCAVCVIDMVEDCLPSKPLGWQEAHNVMPACCNTGCLVCVQDHPELYRNGRPDQTPDQTHDQAQMIALLEAMETAETMAAQN